MKATNKKRNTKFISNALLIIIFLIGVGYFLYAVNNLFAFNEPETYAPDLSNAQLADRKKAEIFNVDEVIGEQQYERLTENTPIEIKDFNIGNTDPFAPFVEDEAATTTEAEEDISQVEIIEQ